MAVIITITLSTYSSKILFFLKFHTFSIFVMLAVGILLITEWMLIFIFVTFFWYMKEKKNRAHADSFWQIAS